MLCLSIRQPYVELILRGEKRIEYRSRPTRRIGERFCIYASLQPGPAEVWEQIGCRPGDLPTGYVVGSAVIRACVTNGEPGMYEWHLVDVKRYRRMRRVAPGRHPQPVWFRPW